LRKGTDRFIILPFRDVTVDIGKPEFHAAFRTTDGWPGGNDGEGAIRALPECQVAFGADIAFEPGERRISAVCAYPYRHG
jgi:hypothetical protein